MANIQKEKNQSPYILTVKLNEIVDEVNTTLGTNIQRLIYNSQFYLHDKINEVIDAVNLANIADPARLQIVKMRRFTFHYFLLKINELIDAVNLGFYIPVGATTRRVRFGTGFVINGLTFVTDSTYFTSGVRNTFSTVTPIAGTVYDAAYDNEIYGPSNSWTFTGLANGYYTVYMHFAELFFNTVGSRVQHVDLNGVRVLTDLDVRAEVGVNFKALVKTAIVNVTGGSILLKLTNVVENSKINSIEILPYGTASGIPLS